MRVVECISARRAASRAWILLLVGSFGCTHSFSPIVLDTVERHLTFEVVIQNPKAYVGSVVLWGGVIRTVMIGPGGTQLIVTQTSLDSKGYPQTRATEGEFIAHTPRHLDLEIFHRDTKVTLAGEIDGVDEAELGPMEYPRPRVRIIEIHAWIGKVWGVFPITRKGWEVDELGPSPSPFEVPRVYKTAP